MHCEFLKGTMNFFTRIVITAALVIASVYTVAQSAGAGETERSCPVVDVRQQQ